MNSESTADSPSEAPRIFNVRRVAVWIAVVLVVFVGLTAFFGLNGMDWLRTVALPPLVQAKGTVKIGTNPLTSGQILTESVDGRLPGSLGIIDENGQFVLRTDVQGSFVEGAYVGEYKVFLSAPRPADRMGVGVPPSLVATKYTSAGTTPIVVKVSRNPADNVFAISVEASEDLPANSAAESSKSKSKEKAPESDPGTMALRMRLSRVDADRNGALTRQELMDGKVDVDEHFAEIDADGSGAIERSEMDQLLKFLHESAKQKSP